MSEELRVHIEYKELKADFTGNYNKVWRLLNDFLRDVQKLASTQQSIKSPISVSSLPASILELRDSKWFDEPRDSLMTIIRLREKGIPIPGKDERTKIKSIKGCLLRLVRKGQLKRFQKEGKYYYAAPWFEKNE